MEKIIEKRIVKGKKRRIKEYEIWAGIKARCYNLNHPNYAAYGARGIKMCDRWKDSFNNFLSDMGYCPSYRHSIDRVDFNGNYEPENCRWADRIKQGNNTRRNIKITHNCRTQTIAEWVRELGLHYGRTRNQVQVKKLTIAQIIEVNKKEAEARNLKKEPTKELLYDLHAIQGLSTRSIGKKLNWSAEYIRRHIIKYGFNKTKI